MKFLNHLRTLNTHHRILRNRLHPLFNTTNFFSDASSLQQSTAPHVQQPPPPSSLNRTPHFQQPSPPSSLNRNELTNFATIAESRYYRRESESSFKPLHAMNPRYLMSQYRCRVSGPLAQMGATVTDTDAVKKNINVDRLHVESDPATSTNESCCTTSEKLDEEGRIFDAAVMALTVGAVIFVYLKVLPIVIPFFMEATIDAMDILLEMSIDAAGEFLAFLIVGATIIYIGVILLAISLISAAIICTTAALLITPGLIFFYPVWLIARKSFGSAAKSSLKYKS